MTAEPRKTRARIDDDGVKVVEVAGVRRGVWLLVLALVVMGVAGVLALQLLLPDAVLREPAVAIVVEATAASASEAAPAAIPRRAHPVRRGSASPPAPSPVSAETPEPESEPVELPTIPDDARGAPSGIALYPPPGTDPPKRGLLVPEDFELPEGYVRHHQATDDGEVLPAILMFHPDYEWLAEDGVAIPLPEDLIVPPELAPPGLPQEWLEIPASESEPTP